MGRAMLLYHRLLQASQHLHTIMLRRIVRVPIAFFDNNPVGRILNRFSNDIGMMDDVLPFIIVDCLGNVFQVHFSL
jgi:ATP-binding cassette subfamily C (CFTR/MRP) protein 4